MNTISLARRRILIFSGVLVLLLTHSGCVALNVPSQRFEDPSDGGGVLGDWRSGHADPLASERLVNGAFSDDENCGCPECASSFCEDGQCESQRSHTDFLGGKSLIADLISKHHIGKTGPVAPEVPWPRFHPVPTRPVFGTDQLDGHADR